MTETTLPVRDTVCRSGGSDVAAPGRHLPEPGTVESGFNHDLEWQFGTCACCRDSISRFRPLLGGKWFDSWGGIPDSAYFFDHRRTTD